MTSKTIGLTEFIDLVGTDELAGFEIDERGVWPEKFDRHHLDLLTPTERAVLLEKPEWHQPGEPLLTFRCEFAELKRLLDWYGMGDLLGEGEGVENPCQRDSIPLGSSSLKNWERPDRLEYLARQIGIEWMNSQSKKPGVIAIAKYVEAELKKRNKTGPRGDYWDWETIKKEALTGITGRKANGKK